MIPIQPTLILSPYIAIYDIVIPKDNMLRQMNDLYIEHEVRWITILHDY